MGSYSGEPYLSDVPKMQLVLPMPRNRFGGEYPARSWSQDLETRNIGYAPPEYRTKQWSHETPMEGWFPLSRGEPCRCQTAERAFGEGYEFQNRSTRAGARTAQGTHGNLKASTRGRLAFAGADAGLQKFRRTGNLCLAILPYGRERTTTGGRSDLRLLRGREEISVRSR